MPKNINSSSEQRSSTGSASRDGNRDFPFHEFLVAPARRRIGRGFLLSVFVHLIVLWGISVFVATPPVNPDRGSRDGADPYRRPGNRAADKTAGPRDPLVLKPGAVRERPARKRRPARIRGYLEVRGVAAAGFRVEARRIGKDTVAARSDLDAQGRFLLRLLPSGRYELSLWHETRILSRIQVSIRSGTFLNLQWRPDLLARLKLLEREEEQAPDPTAFWRLFREPGNRNWRQNREAMLSRAGASRSELYARRRAEALWAQCVNVARQLARSLKAPLGGLAVLIPWEPPNIGSGID